MVDTAVHGYWEHQGVGNKEGNKQGLGGSLFSLQQRTEVEHRAAGKLHKHMWQWQQLTVVYHISISIC